MSKIKGSQNFDRRIADFLIIAVILEKNIIRKIRFR